MLTAMTEEDWTIVLRVFAASRSRFLKAAPASPTLRNAVENTMSRCERTRALKAASSPLRRNRSSREKSPSCCAWFILQAASYT